MRTMLRVAILGGTKGMGRALARRMAERGDAVVLLGRNAADLEAGVRDLEARALAAGVVSPLLGHAPCDLESPDGFAAALDAADALVGIVDTVVVTAGLFAQQGALEDDPALAARLLAVDFTNTVLFCEEARKRLLARGGGRLCVFSSVAGERGRKPVVIYGAAKAGLSRYLEGLDHRFRAAGLVTTCVHPGFVRTGMTAGLPEPPFAGEPGDVADRVLKAIDEGTPQVWAPPIWRWVMLAVRMLPRVVMRKVNF